MLVAGGGGEERGGPPPGWHAPAVGAGDAAPGIRAVRKSEHVPCLDELQCILLLSLLLWWWLYLHHQIGLRRLLIAFAGKVTRHASCGYGGSGFQHVRCLHAERS